MLVASRRGRCIIYTFEKVGGILWKSRTTRRLHIYNRTERLHVDRKFEKLHVNLKL